MWVFDSFSTLVSNALDDKEAKNSQSKAAYSGVITTLFDLNTSILPIAVCSSATTAGALHESVSTYFCKIILFSNQFQTFFTYLVNPHIWIRTSARFSPIVDNKTELKKFVKVLNSGLGSSIVLPKELVDDLISSFGGCLVLYQELLMFPNVADGLKKMKAEHSESLMHALDLQKGQIFSELSLERYELLQAIANGEKIKNAASPAAKYLLAKHGDVQAFLGIHPEGHLIFALPMTKESLKQVAPLIDAKKSLYTSFLRFIGLL